MAKENELTDKEKEEIKALKVGFNIIQENPNPMILSANRVEISRRWSKKLLNIAFVCNIISIVCFVLAAFFVYMKPQPDYYASTPSGRVIGPLAKIQIN